MQPSAADLQLRMATLSNDALRAVLDAREGEYTEAAYRAAYAELACRSIKPGKNTEVSHPAHPVSFVVEDAVSSTFDRVVAPLRWLGDRLDRLLPQQMPAQIKDVFWMAVSSLMPAVFLVGEAVIHVIRSDTPFKPEIGFDEIFFVGSGMTGLLVAYGIYNNYRFARYAAAALVGMLAFYAVWSNWRDLVLSTEDVVTLTVAWGTVKYLLDRGALTASDAEGQRRDHASHTIPQSTHNTGTAR